MSQPIKKEKFTVQAFHHFIKEINSKLSDSTNLSWKDIIRSEFLLDESEEKSLADLPKESSDEVQADFIEISKHLQSGGKVDGKIIENSNKTHTILLFLDFKELFTRSIVIACCDANCRNWKWGKKNCS